MWLSEGQRVHKERTTSASGHLEWRECVEGSRRVRRPVWLEQSETRRKWVREVGGQMAQGLAGHFVCYPV